VTGSVMPLVGETMMQLTWSRGPAMTPRSTASRKPGSSPPRSRAAVPPLERRSERPDSLRRQLHEPLVRVLDEAQRPGRQVHVAVDQARHDGSALEVEHPDVGSESALGAHGLDAGTVKHDCRARPGGPPRPSRRTPPRSAVFMALATIHDGSRHWQATGAAPMR
jgi:hypothetical protein